MSAHKQKRYAHVLEKFSPALQERLLGVRTPAQIQDMLNAIPYNFETDGETCKSPKRVLETNSAHCMEGAMLAVYILGLLGKDGKLLHLMAHRPDDDHVVAVFREGEGFGALSKTNHGVLRYREPVYKTVRELVMSYFHEYFLDTGEKTLYAYSRPLSLGHRGVTWITTDEDLWEFDHALDVTPHFSIATKKQLSHLRKADDVEIAMGKIVEWKNKKI